MSYCPQFWVPGRFTFFERYDQKVIVFAIYGHFHELLPIVLGFQGDLHDWEVRQKNRRFWSLWPFSWGIAHSDSHVSELWAKTHGFAFYGSFNELLPIVLGFQGDLDVLELWLKTRLFSILWPFHELLPTVLGFHGNLHVWEVWSKTRRFVFYGRFHELLPTVFGFQGACFRFMTKNSSF